MHLLSYDRPTRLAQDHANVYYHAVRDDDFGPEWQLRFLFIPVLPSPKWARNPLF